MILSAHPYFYNPNTVGLILEPLGTSCLLLNGNTALYAVSRNRSYLELPQDRELSLQHSAGLQVHCQHILLSILFSCMGSYNRLEHTGVLLESTCLLYFLPMVGTGSRVRAD